VKKPRVGSIIHVYDYTGVPKAAIVTGVYGGQNGGEMSVTIFEDYEHKNNRAMVTRRRLRATPGFASSWVWPPDEEEA